jgi:hypothetical protein
VICFGQVSTTLSVTYQPAQKHDLLVPGQAEQIALQRGSSFRFNVNPVTGSARQSSSGRPFRRFSATNRRRVIHGARQVLKLCGTDDADVMLLPELLKGKGGLA